MLNTTNRKFCRSSEWLTDANLCTISDDTRVMTHIVQLTDQLLIALPPQQVSLLGNISAALAAFRKPESHKTGVSRVLCGYAVLWQGWTTVPNEIILQPSTEPWKFCVGVLQHHSESILDIIASVNSRHLPLVGCTEHTFELTRSVVKFHCLARLHFFVRGLNRDTSEKEKRRQLKKLSKVQAPIPTVIRCGPKGLFSSIEGG